MTASTDSDVVIIEILSFECTECFSHDVGPCWPSRTATEDETVRSRLQARQPTHQKTVTTSAGSTSVDA